MVRIAFLLHSPSPEAGLRPPSAVLAEVVNRLRATGAQVDLLRPEQSRLDIAAIRPQHDLYVLKDKTPLTLSLAGVLALAGATVVNSVESCCLARDKIAATAVLAAAGVPVPASWATGQAGRLLPLLYGGAAWVKPSNGSRGEGVRRLTSPDDLEEVTAPADPYGLPLPLFAQRDVPSSGRDLKVYVAGPAVCAITRPWPARTPEEKLGQPASVSPAIREAALVAGRALGLELYGVDFLICGDRFYVVDVNAFPGYKGAPNAAQHMADYLYQRASQPLARCA